LKKGKYNLIAVAEDKGVVLMTGVQQPNEGKPLEVILNPPTFVEVDLKGLAPSIPWELAWMSDLAQGADARGPVTVKRRADSVTVTFRTGEDQPVASQNKSPTKKDARPGDPISTDEFSLEQFKQLALGAASSQPRYNHNLEYVSSLPGEQKQEVPSRVQIVLHSFSMEEGKLRLGPVPFSGRWALKVNKRVDRSFDKSNATYSSRSINATILQAPVEVELGKTARLELDLTKGETVTGQVLSPAGLPLADVAVMARKGGGGENEPVWAYGGINNSSGRYTLRGVPSGDYTFQATRHAIRTKPG